MYNRVTFVLIVTYFLEYATSINYYCESDKCKVRTRTESGWVCGQVRSAEDGTQYASFQGVPFAKPPLGARRFKELEPADPWGDYLLDATQDAPACPQTELLKGRIPLQKRGMSEDCMYVDVYVRLSSLPTTYPWINEGPGLPILVYTYGGAFQSGAALSDELGPQLLMKKNIVLITIAYRINVFGFYTLYTKEIPGNQGLRDQLTALHWVQRNARFFGGDPDNVTFYGETAHLISLSKAARGLFRRVIMCITAIPSYFTVSKKYAAEVSTLFLREVGINHTDPVLIHRELIRMPLLKIMQGATHVLYNTAFVSFNPVVESAHCGSTRVLDGNPMSLIAQGRGSEYTQLLGFANNAMAFARWVVYEKSFIPTLHINPSAIVSPRLIYSLPEGEVKRIAALLFKRYFRGGIPTVDGSLDCFTDMFFKHPAFKVAEWRAASCAAPTYLYQYAYDQKRTALKYAHWLDYRGATYMDDVHNIFRVNSIDGKYVSYPPITKDDYMSIWLIEIVTNFMTCDAPICDDGSAWPPVNARSLHYNLIDEPMRIKMMEPTWEESELVEFYDSFDPESRNITETIIGECCDYD